MNAKTSGITLAVTFWAASIFGQYASAPARDARDAVRYLQETQRSIDPVLNDIRDEADVLRMLASAEIQLKDSQPASSFDDADHVIDSWLSKRHEAESTLSRDLDRTIAAARQILAVNKPILNVAAAREQLHHQVIHPLQRDAMRNAGDLQMIVQQLQFMQGRIQTQVLPQLLTATGFSATDPK